MWLHIFQGTGYRFAAAVQLGPFQACLGVSAIALFCFGLIQLWLVIQN
jgi:hypothetical protein